MRCQSVLCSIIPCRPSPGVARDLTVTLERSDGILFLPVILKAQRLTGRNTDVSEVPGGEGLPSRATYRPCFYPGQHFHLYRGTSWPPVPHLLAGCLRLHNNIRHQRSVLICHRDVMGVPLAVKIGVLATTSVGHVAITGGTAEPPTEGKTLDSQDVLET